MRLAATGISPILIAQPRSDSGAFIATACRAVAAGMAKGTLAAEGDLAQWG